jgi:DNA-binding SARP family transcriptional activator
MFTLYMLGGLALEEAGAAPTPARLHRKAMAVLVLLAMGGERGVTRDKLIGFLWPDSTESHARGSLKQELHAIRQRLGAKSIVSMEPQLHLNPLVVRSDVGRFLESLRRHDLEGAVSEYGGPFLDGVHLAQVSEFEQWVEGRRSHLQDLRQGALEGLAVAADRDARLQDAIRWWQVLRDSDPLSARCRIGLMRALVAAGDPAAALREARLHGAVLERELGCGPDPKVRELETQLRSASGQGG